MKLHSISEVSLIVNQSRQSVYKKLNQLSQEDKIKLGENLVYDGKIKLSDEGINLLFKVSTFDNQVDKMVDNSIDNEVVKILKNQLTDKEREVYKLGDIVDKILNQLEEERRLRGEERRRTDTILLKLTQDVSTLQKTLEYRNVALNTEPLRHVHPWQPKPAPNPLEGKPWFQRLAIKLFHPEQLRRDI